MISLPVKESLTEEGDLDRLLDSDEFKTSVSEEEINAARREVAKESLKEKCGKQKITEESDEEAEDDSTAPTIYHLFLDDKLVYESESIPLNKALSEITTYIKKLTPEQKRSFSLSWEFDESGYYNKPIYDNEGNIVGSREDWKEVDGDVIVGVFSESECKEYGYAFPEDRLVINVDYAGEAIRKAFDANVTTNLKEEKEDESEVEENDDDSEEVCFTAEEVKEVATDVAQSLATPVEDEEEAEEQAKEIAEVVDEKVDEAIEEKIEEADEDEIEEAGAEEDESDDEESEEEIEEPEFNEDDIDELDEDSLNKHIDEYLKEVYSNVKSYKTTDCMLKEGKLIVEGKISFNSGKEKLTMFEFLPVYCEGNLFFEGYNKDFSGDKAFTLNCSINESKTLITESFGYKYKINENLVEGLK